MALRKYTTDELVKVVRLRGMLGNVESSGTKDQDIIDHLNDAMMEELVPKILSVREEYFVIPTRIATATGTIRWPERAVGNKLRDVALWRSDSDRSGLPRVSPPQKYGYGSGSTPVAYYIEGNNIKLLPEGSSGTIEMGYFFRPGQLVKSLEAGVVSSIDLDNKKLTLVSNPPTTWDSSKKIDIHSGFSGGEIRQFSLSLSGITGAELTFSDAIDGSSFGTHAPAPGDYVCLEGEAVLPALPIELHPVLAQAAVVKVAESMGDTESVTIHQGKLNRMLQQCTVMIDYRVEGTPQKIVNTNSLWAM